LLNGPKGTPIDYAQGIAAYAIINLVLVILIPLFTGIFIVFRYCCCCCKANKCTCLRCGTPWPTKRTCCCGFKTLPTGEFGYSCLDRGCSFAWLAIFIIFMIAMILMGELQGNKGISTGMQNLVGKDTGVGNSVMDLVERALDAITNLVIGLSGSALAPTLNDIGDTLNTAVDLNDVTGALICVQTSLNSLPDITLALGFMGALQAGLTNVTGSIDTIEGEVNNLLDVKATVEASADNLTAALNAMGTTFVSVGTSLSAAADVADGMVLFQDAMVDPTTGYLVRGKADLEDFVNNFPPSNDFTGAAGPTTITDFSGTATMNRLIGDQMAGNPTEINALVTKLDALNTALAGLPDLDNTADILESINDEINKVLFVDPLIADLQAALVSAQASLASLPGRADLEPKIDAIINAADSVDVTPLIAAINSIDVSIKSLPDFNTLLNELSKTKLLKAIVPCVEVIVAQIDGINRTIAKLPASVAGITDMLASANETINSALAQLDSTDQQIRDANATIRSTDVSKYAADVEAVQDTINTQKADLNVTELKNKLSDLDTKKTVDFSAILGDLSSLAATLANNTISNVTIAELRSFKQVKVDLVTALQAETNNYRTYAKGYCQNKPAFDACASDSECSPTLTGQCQSIAIRRCSGTDQLTACSQDSDCTSGVGSVCLVDTTRATALKLLLENIVTQVPDVSDAVSSIDSAITAANINIASEKSKITDAEAAIGAIDTSAFVDVLQSMTSGMDSFDAAATLNSLTDIKNTIDAVPFNDFSAQLNDVSATIDSLDGVKSQVGDAVDTSRTLAKLLYQDLDGYIDRLSTENLQTVDTSLGLGSVITSITGVVDEMITDVRTGQNLVPIPDIEITSMVSEYTPYVDKASGAGAYADFKAHGPANYFASIAAENAVQQNSAQTKYVLTDVDGTPYFDGRICLSSECLSATVAVANTEQLTAMGPAFEISGMPDIPLSRENILTILWVFPILVILLGAWAMCAPVCCKNPGWQKIPASCMTGCIICQLPCIFLITGVFFPMMLLLGDTCGSGVNVGYNVSLASLSIQIALLLAISHPSSSPLYAVHPLVRRWHLRHDHRVRFAGGLHLRADAAHGRHPR
jgi:hypothetical protein